MGCLKTAYRLFFILLLVVFPQWSGNISAMEWQTPAKNSHRHAYAFNCDGLNRLSATAYAQQQTLNDSVKAVTDIVYDDFGRKAYVLTPGIAEYGLDTVWLSFGKSDKELKELYSDAFTYAYRYDHRGREVAKKLPWGNWIVTVYDRLDRPVFTRDDSQWRRGLWSFVKYDVHGRVALAGLYRSEATREELQSLVDAEGRTLWESRTEGGQWSNAALPDTAGENATVLAVNYYDNYGFAGAEAGAGLEPDPRVHGKQTGGRVRVPDSDPVKWLHATLYYDSKQRVVQTVSDNISGGKDRVTSTYNFPGWLMATKHEHTGAEALTVSTVNRYDHAGRLIEVRQHVSGGDTVTVAQNEYSELGQLIKTKLHRQPGGNWLETVDYDYNIRSGLQSIDGTNFSQDLHYQNTVSGLNNPPQWSGNISAMEWTTPAKNEHRHAYAFNYDNLNRLTKGSYARTAGYGGYGTEDRDLYNEDYQYSLTGGIRLNRTQDTVPYKRPFSFNYRVNHLKKITHVDIDGRTMDFVYDAAGNKLHAVLPDSSTRTYVDGIEYKNSTLDLILTPYGRIRKNGLGEWVYDYFLKDHLGSVRTVITADPVNTTTYTATMEDNRAGEEEEYFANVAATRADRPYNYPDVNPANAKLSKVPGKSEGPKLKLKVLAGDTLTISAKAFYNMDNTFPGDGVNLAPILGSALAAMTNPVSSAIDYTAQLAADLGAEASQSVALMQVPENDDDSGQVQPEAGINFVLYNDRFDIVEENTGAVLVEDRINEIQTLATDKIIIKESGFIEIFAGNEAQTPVYFDNIIVTHSASSVLEVNAYYPYGSIIKGLSVESAYAPNAYKYINKESLDSLMLGWLVMGERIYDPRRGKFLELDPLAELYYSIDPMAYALNNPVNFSDPTGMFATRYEDESGNLLLNTNDGSDAFVTVTNEKMSAFVWSVTHTTPDNINSQEWNRGWVQNLTGIQMTDAHDWALGLTHSDASKRALMNFWQTGKTGDFVKFELAELGAQWTDPVLVATGVLSGVVGLAATAERAALNAAKGGISALKPLGLGSTGRTTAANLVEQMAMKDAMANPQFGRRIVENLTDPRWTGWTKMQYSVTSQNGVKAVVHYVGKWENGILKAVDDFKFK